MSRLLKEDAAMLGEAYAKILLNEMMPLELGASAAAADTPEKKQAGAIDFAKKSHGWILNPVVVDEIGKKSKTKFHMFVNKTQSGSYEGASTIFRFQEPGISEEEKNKRKKAFIGLCFETYNKVVDKLQSLGAKPGNPVSFAGGDYHRVAALGDLKGHKVGAYTSATTEYKSAIEKKSGEDYYALVGFIIQEVFAPAGLVAQFRSQATHFARDMAEALIDAGVVKYVSAGGGSSRSKGSASVADLKLPSVPDEFIQGI